MRALVLSGGGSKGAYEVGALKYLLGNLKVDYDLFAGVSVGAINAAFLAMYPAKMHPGLCGGSGPAWSVRQLESMWDGMDNSKVYRNWFLPYISALWKPSVYNSAPLQELIRDELRFFTDEVNASGKKLRIGATGLDTGEYRVFDETYSDVPGAVLASSAFPGMLTPVKLDGQLWADGGIRSTTPLAAAIQAGATDIDVVLCSPSKDPSTAFTGKTDALSVGMRAIDLMSDQIEDNDLKVCQVKNDVNRLAPAGLLPPRYINLRVVRPNKVLVKDPLDFSPNVLASLRAQGYADAIKQLRT